MMTRRLFVAAWVALVFVGVARGQAEFVPGRILVSVSDIEGCDFGFPEAIVEIDPTTGAWSIFADSTGDGICLVNGLRFTPEGDRLLALNFGHIVPFFDGGWIQAFNPDGTSEVILDASDGIFGPNGANALAFDPGGDLYVLNAQMSTILRFPADGGPATVFANSNNGIFGRGALDFAPNGDLFYCGAFADAIIRIRPNGESSVFDDPPGSPSSLAFDRAGNLFVGSSGIIFRYDNADPGSRRVLATNFLAFSGVPMALRLSPDGSAVYFLEMFGTVYHIDAENGSTRVVADLSDLPFSVVIPGGITVYAPVFPAIPTISEWGMIVMTLILLMAGMIIVARRAPRLLSCRTTSLDT